VIYSAATAFVWPSLYEGFGLPPLEAMACGTPVVCADASSMHEVVGDAARLFDPQDVEAMRNTIRRLVMDRALRDELHRGGLVQAAKFSWSRAARETLAVYDHLLAAHSS